MSPSNSPKRWRDRSRQAAQDHGARRFIGNNADAGILGDCGEAAARATLGVVLRVLDLEYHPQGGENPAHPVDVLVEALGVTDEEYREAMSR